MLAFFQDRRVRRGLCMLAALPAAFSFTYLLRTGQNFTMINHSIVSALLWWACSQVMEAAYKQANHRLICVCAPLGLIFSMMMVFGSMVMQYQTALFFQLKTWVGVVCAWPLAASVCMLLIGAMPKAPAIRFEAGEKWFARISGKQLFLLCWAVIFLSWLPGLIATYPGVYGYDGPFQVDYYLKQSFSTHHPVAHSWWFGFCVVTVGDWLGSYEAGMCVYSVQQMLILSAAFASVMRYLHRRRTGAVMQLCCLLAFMFLPVNAVFSFSATKDVPFSALMTWTLLWMLDAAHEPEAMKKPGKWVRLLALGLGLAVMRKQGVYVFALALCAGLLLMPGMRRRILCVLCAFVLLFGVYDGPVQTLLKADRVDAVQEMLSVPILQLCCARVRHGGEMTEEDRAAIESYIPHWSNYDHTTWGIADPMKNTFSVPLFREDPMAFVKLWARMGLAHPEAYIDSFLRLTAGYWYPDMTWRDYSAQQPYFQYENIAWDGWVQLERTTPKALRWLNALYADLSNQNSDQKIPVLSLVTSSSVAAWVMLLFAAWAVYERRWRMLWPSVLLIGLWGTLLLGPIVLLRYAYPLLMAMPVLIGTMRSRA